MIRAMMDAETRELVGTARGRREIEISARLISHEVAPPEARLDSRAAAARAQAWADARARILEAVAGYGGDGLKVLRSEKTRPGVILRGPVAGWRRFLAEQRTLVEDRTLEFRFYHPPWTRGLPGFPE